VIETGSSTGLSTTTGSALAYVGGWVTGFIFWFIERRDGVVRFHGAQALVAFGALAFIIAALGTLALVSLSFFPGMFSLLVIAAQVVAALAVVLWAVSVWQVASGRDWRLPVAGHWAERLVTSSRRAGS
jgi:uncharacterized membrane protein